MDEAAQNLLKERTVPISAVTGKRSGVHEEGGGRELPGQGSHRWDGRGRKVFYLIEKVNHSLESLATMVLQKQTDTMKLMAALDEIRGLLLDLYY